LERLVLLCAQRDAAGGTLPTVPVPDVYVVSRGEQAERQALVLSRQLRQAGQMVELDLTGSAFGKQLKRADRCGAPWAVVIGEEEAQQGVVVLKNLRRSADSPEEERLQPAELLRQLGVRSA
ncbi:MAG: His/Gly/Thr/Pro-type tRNA ligase C-terminal domain-containing protein, partial [Cyanobacteria bacterium]|nr:His/Gly/Thr/Pro-type tRNA ligase C-terminal domain-containing protein [Cyanobacteriota bacterium]